VKFHHRERVPIKIWYSSFTVVLKPPAQPQAWH
jgi:hypothetical protein